MNAPASQPVLWSRGRVWGYFLAVLAVQVVLLFALSEKKPILPRTREPGTAFYAVIDPEPDDPVTALLTLQDPTLFALPHPRGFSGRAWLHAVPLEYESTNWEERPHLLAQNEARLGGTFQEFLRTNEVAYRSAAAKPPAPPDRALVPPLPVRIVSSYRVEGDLARCELVAPLDVPSVSYTNILTNTVVQLAVNAAGVTFSAVALEESGSKLADQRALDLARSARFKRASPSSSPGALTWGRIIFQWHTLETPAANGAAPP